MRLGLLLALLAGLAVYAASTWTGLGGGDGASASEHCPQTGSPEVREAGAGQVRALRAALQRVVFFAPGIESYEQGPAATAFAWTDGEPGNHNAVPEEAEQPGGWEMRWWAPTRDDVVADAFLFARPALAREFFKRASSAECRTAAVSGPAAFPPGARNLGWLNPDGFAQEDLYLQRGRRVYRISVVRPGSEGRANGVERRQGFTLVSILACALPGARCPLRGLEEIAQRS